MSLQTRVEALATRVAQEINTLRATRPLEPVDFGLVGAMAVGVGTLYVPITGGTFTISTIAARLRVAGSTSTVLDVKKNGTTIFGTSGNRPTFGSGANLATIGSWSTTTVTTGDYLSMDVVTAGTSASDLVLRLRLLRTA